MKKVYLLPNLLTTGNLVFGLLSIINGIAGNYEKACWCILISIIFDGLDGKVAILTKTTSDFGINYDSISDMVSFGVAPALLGYNFFFQPQNKVGVALVIIFAVCVGLRLARYNVQAYNEEKGGFVGLPSPTGGGMVAVLILCMCVYELKPEPQFIQIAFQLILLMLSILMVSKVPYPNFKKLHLEGRKPFSYLVIFILILGITIMNPPLTFLSLFSIYVFWGIIKWLTQTSESEEPSPLTEQED